jgi:hypothetical protein
MPFLLGSGVDFVDCRFALFSSDLRIAEVSRHTESAARSFLAVITMAHRMNFRLALNLNRGLPAAACSSSNHGDLLLVYA